MVAKTVTENLRLKLGLSQDALSKAFGLSGRNAISRWETGRRSPGETIHRLIKLLNDLPRKEARRLIQRLETYGTNKKAR